MIQTNLLNYLDRERSKPLLSTCKCGEGRSNFFSFCVLLPVSVPPGHLVPPPGPGLVSRALSWRDAVMSPRPRLPLSPPAPWWPQLNALPSTRVLAELPAIT